jgi:transcriptional regulator with XRE-family HTH domain
VDPSDAWETQRKSLGEFIRAQRTLAQLSLRQLSELTNVSNAYLSQVERGLHQPSLRVLRSIADALHVSSETLLAQAGLLDEDDDVDEADAVPDVERAIRADPRLSEAQKDALVSVYRSYVTGHA